MTNPSNSFSVMGSYSHPKQHIKMKKGGFESQLENVSDSILNDFDDDLDSRMYKNMNMPLSRGKNNGSGGLRKNNGRSLSRGNSRSTTLSFQKNCQNNV